MNLSSEQFEKLLSVIGSQRRGSFAACKVSFSGTRDTESVETFLASATVYKSVEQISDNDAIMGVPLLLKEEAAIWWNGIKEEVTTWTDFQARVRHAFAPKRPAYQVYQDIIGIKQEEMELTEVFIAKKRALFAQLPEPAHTEAQQLDMIYGQIRYLIRVKLSREIVQSYDELLKAARGIEQLLTEKQPQPQVQPSQIDTKGKSIETPAKKARCGYCRFPGHTMEDCRRRLKDGSTANSSGSTAMGSCSKPTVSASGTQAPSPSQPKFSCYGCGTPGVVRSKCPTCSKKPVLMQDKQEISFCSINVRTDARPRPVIGIGLGKIVGTAYIDSCAKTSVASYSLYQCLKKLGYHFEEHQVMVTLADGGKTQRDVLTVKAPIHLCDHVIPTTFIIFPESRESRTLLGIGFIQDAGMVLNIPQMNWHFIGEPDVIYDLQEESVEEASMAHVETTPHSSPSLRKMIKDVQLPEVISPLSITPPDIRKTPDRLTPRHAAWEPALPQPSACAAMGVSEKGGSKENPEPALPERSAGDSIPYRMIPLDSPSPPSKRSKTLFDGYSPSFVDYMYRDAQLNMHETEVELSPHSRMLFPSDDGSDDGSNDVVICSISLGDVITEEPRNLKHLMTFLQTCSWFRRFIPNLSKISEPLTRLTKKKSEWKWTEEQETAFLRLKTRLTTAPVLRQADETKSYIIKTDASNYALGAVLVQGEGEDEHPGYKPGDLVLATTHPVSKAAQGISSKFCPRRDGPYLIHNRHGVSSYVLSDPATPHQALGVYHTSALTPYQGSSTSLPAPVRPLKKRGRPAKPKPAPDSTQPTRGRGRPRKIVTQSNLPDCLLVGAPSHPEGETEAQQNAQPGVRAPAQYASSSILRTQPRRTRRAPI